VTYSYLHSSYRVTSKIWLSFLKKKIIFHFNFKFLNILFGSVVLCILLYNLLSLFLWLINSKHLIIFVSLSTEINIAVNNDIVYSFESIQKHFTLNLPNMMFDPFLCSC
jgi:hypothetical protein